MQDESIYLPSIDRRVKVAPDLSDAKKTEVAQQAVAAFQQNPWPMQPWDTSYRRVEASKKQAAAQDESRQAAVKTSMGVLSPLTRVPLLGPAAAGAWAGLLSMPAQIEARVGRIVGWDALARRGDRVLGEVERADDAVQKGDFPVLDASASFLGQQAAPMLVFGAGGALGARGAKATLEAPTFIKALAKGAGVGTAIESTSLTLDIAGARSPEERKQTIKAIPQRLISAAGFAAVGGAVGTEGSRKAIARFQEASEASAAKVDGLLTRIDDDIRTGAVQATSARADLIAKKVELEQANEELAAKAVTHDAAMQRIQSSMNAHQHAASDLAEATRSVTEMPEVPSEASSERAPSRESAIASITARRAEALDTQRRALGVEKATRLELARSTELYQKEFGGEFDWDKYTKLTGTEAPTAPERAAATVSADATVAANAVDNVAAGDRRANALKWAATGDVATATRELRDSANALDAAASATTQADVEALKPKTNQVKFLQRVAEAVSGLTKDVRQMFLPYTDEQERVSSEARAAQGKANQAKYQAEQLRKDLKAALPNKNDRAVLRLLFDRVGRQKVEAADAARRAGGQPPIVTPEMEHLRSAIQTALDRIWGVQASLGRIDMKRFNDTYMPQWFKNVGKAKAYYAKHPFMPEGGPFNIERFFDNIYQAASASKGELELASYDPADILPAVISQASDLAAEAEVRNYVKSTIPSALITSQEWDALPFEQKKGYTKLSNGELVRDDIYQVTKSWVGERPASGKVFRTLQDLKWIKLSVDFQHAMQTSKTMLTHPKAWNPVLGYQSIRGALERTELLQNYMREGGGRLDHTGGDYESVSSAVRGPLRAIINTEIGGVRPLHASHNFVFSKIIPAQKAIVAYVELKTAFEARANGSKFFKGMTDREIYQHVAKNVENEFGNFDLKLSHVAPVTQKALRTVFLAPEWSLSMLRMSMRALEEQGKFFTRQGTDFYNSKRILGVAATAYLATQVTNSYLKGKYATDYDPERDWFSIVLPAKDPQTGRNLRFNTVGPQLQFLKYAYDVADYTLTQGGPKLPAFAKALANEVVMVGGNKAHFGWKVPAEILTRQKTGTEAAEEFALDLSPMSSPDLMEAARSLASDEHMTTAENAARLVGTLTGTGRLEARLPQLVMSSYMEAKRDIAAHKTKLRMYSQRGLKARAEDEAKSMIEARNTFIAQWAGTKYWPILKRYVSGLR
jgi:hypothetical protein